MYKPAIKLGTIRYLLSLNGRAKDLVWKKGKQVFVYIDAWPTPRYDLLTSLRNNGYTVVETKENLTYEIRKED